MAVVMECYSYDYVILRRLCLAGRLAGDSLPPPIVGFEEANCLASHKYKEMNSANNLKKFRSASFSSLVSDENLSLANILTAAL